MLLTVLPALIYLGLIIYSVFDVIAAGPEELHRLTRAQWIAVVILVPLLGAVCWLLTSGPRRGRHEHAAGHPAGTGWSAAGMSQYPIGPDDDPDFLAGLGRAQNERRRLLTRQEEERSRHDQGQTRPDQQTRPEQKQDEPKEPGDPID